MTQNRLRLLAAFLPALMLGTAVYAQDIAAEEPLVGDPERGKVVYQRIGICVDCHGWAGDGRSGRNPRSPDAGASLRETTMFAEDLVEVVRCGRPGTQMPHFEGAAYRDDRCYGLTMEDFGDDEIGPIHGKTFREQDAYDVVAYLQQSMIGLGDPNYEECAACFGDSADRPCPYLQDDQVTLTAMRMAPLIGALWLAIPFVAQENARIVPVFAIWHVQIGQPVAGNSAGDVAEIA